MRYAELDLFGVFVSPLAPMLVGAWIVLVLVRRIVLASGWQPPMWHPALFTLSAYVILLSCLVLLAGRV